MKIGTAVLLGMLFLAQAARAQSLADTERWIQDTLNPTGMAKSFVWPLAGGTPLLFPNEYNGYLGFTTLIPPKVNPNRNESTILSFTFDGCTAKATVFTSVPSISGGLPEYYGDHKGEKSPMTIRSLYTDTFNLKDMDPGRVEFDGDGSFPEAVGKRIVIHGINDRMVVHCQSVVDYSYGKPNPDKCFPGPDFPSEELGFNSMEYAKRFQKAIVHAIELCGGKPSVF